VDDSAIVRKILAESLAGEPDIEVVGTAPDPYLARDRILTLHPDVLTLDIEMPRMDGLTFLQKLMIHHPMPVVVISSLAQPACHAAVRALELGAVEVLAKPGGPYSVGELRESLAAKLRAAAGARLGGARDPAGVAPASFPQGAVRGLIAIGASTGGTEAITAVLSRLPRNSPPVAVVQHIPPGFSRAFAERLNENCELEVREAADGDTLAPGRALIAPGDLHMVLRRNAAGYLVNVKGGPRVCYQRPSVDVLFSSAAEAAGAEAAGVLLTGMGADGAQGLLKMRRAGACTIAQDEATSVVFGMPREAIRLGAAEHVLPLGAIAGALAGAAVAPSRAPVSAQRHAAGFNRLS
jgi:two-component system chemotaxis response regulator CheB